MWVFRLLESVGRCGSRAKSQIGRGTPPYSPRLHPVATLPANCGESTLGVNPFLTYPMRDILYDEKIAGSLHLTPGDAYAEADNGNKSAIHWDLVLIQTPEWGGGEIWFDGVLMRKDGLFVLGGCAINVRAEGVEHTFPTPHAPSPGSF